MIEGQRMISEEQANGFSLELEDLEVPVLCYPFPETREILDKLWLPESFHRPTLTEVRARELLRAGGYSFHEDLKIPVTPSGRVDFEELQGPAMQRITERNKPLLRGISKFEHRYATTGSADAIFRLMAGWSRSGKMTKLGYVKGDYIGYLMDAEYALGIERYEVDSLEEAGEPVDGVVWFVSNPSAIDGNLHSAKVWQKFVAAGHTIVVDYAYGGLVAEEHKLDVSADNIVAVLTSPSKIFGVFNHRQTGVAYTREDVPALYTTAWFKTIPGMMNALMLYETFEPYELARKYQEYQEVICRTIGRLVGKEVLQSNAILIAHTTDGEPKSYRLSTAFSLLEEFVMAE